jgi:hypothetical protein
MEPLNRIIELVKESNFKDANEICFDALYSKIEEKLNEKAETVRESCNCNNGNEELDPVNKKALKGKHKDRKDKDIDNDGDVDSSDKYLHKRRKAVSKAVSEDDEKDFKPHMMYDTKTGKGYKAETYKDHLDMKKKGYTHEKPEVKEGYESKSVPLVRTGQGSFTKDTHPKRKDGKVERMYQAKDKAEYQKLQGAAKSFDSKPNRKSLAVTVVFDNDKQRKAFEKKMKVEAYHEGAEMDIAKEKEKMAGSQEKIRDLAIKLKKEKDRKRTEA